MHSDATSSNPNPVPLIPLQEKPRFKPGELDPDWWGADPDTPSAEAVKKPNDQLKDGEGPGRWVRHAQRNIAFVWDLGLSDVFLPPAIQLWLCT